MFSSFDTKVSQNIYEINTDDLSCDNNNDDINISPDNKKVATKKSDFDDDIISNTSSEYENIILDNNLTLTKKSRKMSQDIICDVCNYKTNIKSNFNKHITTVLHKRLVKIQTDNQQFICKYCDYFTTRKNDYDKHVKTKKHKSKYKNCKYTYDDNDKNVYNNEIINNDDIFSSMSNDDLYSSIMSEIKVMMIEQNKMIQDIANKPSNNVTNNNTNHQSFNLNMFLNETCKDAMNIGDFIAGMNVTVEDMELTGTLGFAKAMSHIIMKNLNALDVCKRPIHCSDVKRETMYYKHNGVWEKDTDDKKKTKEIIYNLSFVNWKRLMEWRFLPRNKGYNLSDHYKNDEFTKLVMEVNTVDENEINKVVTYLCRDVAIDKAKVRAGGYRK